eukprot:5591200-Pleurochrysis_carterae.AAC.1
MRTTVRRSFPSTPPAQPPALHRLAPALYRLAPAVHRLAPSCASARRGDAHARLRVAVDDDEPDDGRVRFGGEAVRVEVEDRVEAVAVDHGRHQVRRGDLRRPCAGIG